MGRTYLEKKRKKTFKKSKKILASEASFKADNLRVFVFVWARFGKRSAVERKFLANQNKNARNFKMRHLCLFSKHYVADFWAIFHSNWIENLTGIEYAYLENCNFSFKTKMEKSKATVNSL